MHIDISSPSLTATPCERCAGECLVACFNDAITYEQEQGYRVIEENCAGCGACVPACDQGLIYLERGTAFIADGLLVA